MSPFLLAIVQMRVVPGHKTENLRHAAELVRQAADAGAQVVLLPEALTLGWTHPAARTESDPIPLGGACVHLRDTARGCGVWLCAGLEEHAGDRVYNAAVLINPQGEVVLHHRKINELTLAHDVYALGDRMQVAETPFGRIGVMICADGFAKGQVLSRTLGYMGAHVILSPCAWAVPADHDNAKTPYGGLWLENYCPVALDFRLWIAAASNVGPITAGPWAGRKCIGCSMVINPAGQPALRAPYGENAEQVLLVKITPEPRPAQGTGWADAWG